MNYYFQGDETVCRPDGANCDLKCLLCTGVPLRSTPAYDLVAPLGLSLLPPVFSLSRSPLWLSTAYVFAVEKPVRALYCVCSRRREVR